MATINGATATVEPAVEGLRHQYAVVNGVRLHYVEAGRGPLVVLLHGFPEFWYSWRHQIDALAPYFHVVAPDQRGYNLSEKPHGVSAYKVETLVEDVAALIHHLGEEQAVIVGHDWGGGVAWSFAIAHPEMTRRLIVLNCPHPAAMARGLRTLKQLRRSWYMFFFQLPKLPEWSLRIRNYRAIESAFRGMVHRPGTFTDADIRAYKEAAAQPGALSSEINWYRALLRGGVRQMKQSYPTIEAPTLLIWGEDDTALGKELTYGTERWAPHLTVRYIPNTSHWVQQEQPELVNRYMLEFLGDLLPAGRAPEHA